MRGSDVLSPGVIDETAIRERAEALGAALVAGDVDQAIADFSVELRRNLGEVLALFPLPVTEATVESVERAGSGFNVIHRLVGETDEVEVQTRWKDRDGVATVVEASHLSSKAREVEQAAAEAEVEEQADTGLAG
jgi:hypothetical protein